MPASTISRFPNYAITRDGRVWSKPRTTPHGHKRKGRWLKTNRMPTGHLSICLYKNRISHKQAVHRLVLETYVGPCPSGMECRHLNGNPADNHLENLCWGTHSENVLDAVKHGTHVNNRGAKQGRSKLTEVQVRVIMFAYLTGKVTQEQLAQAFEVSISTIKSVTQKRNWAWLFEKVA